LYRKGRLKGGWESDNFLPLSDLRRKGGGLRRGMGNSKQFNSGKICPPPNSKIRGRADLPPVLFL